MALVMTAAPDAEPISLAEAKATFASMKMMRTRC
jgi:hypothetical protein